MFISPKTLALMEENSKLKQTIAALEAENVQLARRLADLQQVEDQRQMQERRIARQFDNLFAYTGKPQEEKNED